MNTNTKKWILASALVLACGGLIPVLSHHGSATASKTSAPGAIVNTSSTGATYTTAALFPMGVMQEYDMVQTTTMSTSTGQEIGQLAFDGKLTLTGLEAGAKIVVRGQYTGMFTSRAAGTTDQTMTDAAQKPFFLEFSPDGTFLRSLGDASVPPVVARIWVAFGEYIQLLRQGGGDHWQSHEHDGLGAYLADYDQTDRNNVDKRRVKYETLNAHEFEGSDITLSRIHFQVDARTGLEAYDLEENAKLDPGAGGPLPAFQSVSKLTLKRTRVSVPSKDLQAWATQSKNARALDKVRHEQDEKTRDKERIANSSLPQVFDDLRGLNNDKTSKEQRQKATRAFVTLTSYLREDPKTLDMVKKHLAKKGEDTETMLAALRDASTPDSQKLLAEMSVKSSPLDPFNRMEAVRSLSRVPTPSAETIQTLKDLRNDPEVWVQANYGLGSSLHKIMDTDPIEANDIRSTLETQLTSASTDTVRSVTLIALGNAGDPSTLDTIAKYANDPNPSVRGAAAQALRRIPGDQADAILARLATDPDINVRYRTVDAISERSASQVLATALATIALGDNMAKIRAAAVSTLAGWVSDIPGIANTLQMVAVKDTNADIKAIAQRALAPT